MSRTRDPLHAFLDLPDKPIPHAPSGPLAGKTLGVKDIFDVAGYRTGCGNPQRLAAALPAETTAPAVQALLDAGARFAGKTQTDELAFSLMGINAHFPAPVNPAARNRVTGGSSSGSAAAVAGGLADIAIGTDTGGSIRAPASFCGLIGLRTTHGRISRDGVMPLAPSFDTVGWFARDIETYERVAEVLLNESEPPLRLAALGEGVLSPRAFALPALEELLLSDSERSEFRRMTSLVAGALGAPEQRSLNQDINDLYWSLRKLQAYEAWAVHGPWISAKNRGLGPGVRERFEFGATIDCAVAAAETARRTALRAALGDLLADDGFLILPTVPSAAPRKDASFDDLQAYRERALRLLCLSGLSGFPQISLPLGQVESAPFGISLIGPAGCDMALIGIGRTLLGAAGKG